MNSKLYFFLICLLVSSCGVKGPPVAPRHQNIPSIMKDYPDIQLPDVEVEKLDRHKVR